MKLKTNKLLTLTLASSLVAITAGCGGTKAAAPKGGTDDKTPDVTIADVAYSAWSGSDNVTIATDDTANAFLAGVAATTTTEVTLTGVTTGATVETLNLAYEVTEETDTAGTTKGLNAVTFGGAATNGVAFATNGDSTPADLLYFAGVIAGADLGAPLTTTTAAGTWNGIFQAVGANAVERDFELTVDFTNTQVSAIVPLTGDDASATSIMSYFFEGDFNAAGVITGDIIFGDFSAAADAAAALTAAGVALTAATADDAEDSDTVGLGTLSGLIGADGALGAFYSSGSDGTGATGFAGGFVALTAENVGGDDPDVVYADWSGSATLVTAITANGFVAGNATGLVPTAITATAETVNLAAVIGQVDAIIGTGGSTGTNLGGAATNGVAFASTGSAGTSRYFAGLHNTTDLGAPFVTAGTEAEWTGAIQVISGTAASAFDAKVFTLTVNFGTTDAARTISAHVAVGTLFTGTSYYLSGTYDANGVITGTVSSGVITNDAPGRAAATETGTLSGLIGATGAVGAFHSTAQTALGYAGGFVAAATGVTAATDTPALIDPATVVNYADWTLTAATDLTANGFVVGTATGATGQPSSGAITISRAGSAAGGVTFFRSGTAGSEFYHAAIHSDTSLGAPVSTTVATATWTGNFGAVGETGYATASRTAMFAVTFGGDGARTIQSTVAAGTATFAAAAPAYHINATYTAAGLISGNILYQTSSDAADAGVTAAGTATAATAGFGTVTGLIGADGLVGAFHSSATTGSTGATGYAGGFVAAPPAPGS